MGYSALLVATMPEGLGMVIGMDELDIRLARDAVPSLAISHWNEPTPVSKRVGCVVLRPPRMTVT